MRLATFNRENLGTRAGRNPPLGDRIANELKRGQLDQVFVRGEDGYVVLVSIGEEAVLTALALSRAKLGLVFLEMKRTANELSNLV